MSLLLLGIAITLFGFLAPGPQRVALTIGGAIIGYCLLSAIL